jgi:hypothetical protein
LFGFIAHLPPQCHELIREAKCSRWYKARDCNVRQSLITAWRLAVFGDREPGNAPAPAASALAKSYPQREYQDFSRAFREAADEEQGDVLHGVRRVLVYKEARQSGRSEEFAKPFAQ